jgi:hypothetical protein
VGGIAGVVGAVGVGVGEEERTRDDGLGFEGFERGMGWGFGLNDGGYCEFGGDF